MVTHRAGRTKPHMTNLPRISAGPQIQTTVGNDARTQPRAQGKKHHMVAAHSGAESMFRHRARIGVVLHLARRVKSFFQQTADRHIDPGRKIRRSLDDSFHPIERAAAAHADGLHSHTMLRQQTPP